MKFNDMTTSKNLEIDPCKEAKEIYNNAVDMVNEKHPRIHNNTEAYTKMVSIVVKCITKLTVENMRAKNGRP